MISFFNFKLMYTFALIQVTAMDENCQEVSALLTTPPGPLRVGWRV